MKVIAEAPSKHLPGPVPDATAIKAGLERIIGRAIELGASDIHLEPRDGHVLVRYRVGSNLQLGTKLPLVVLPKLTDHIKRLAKIPATTPSWSEEGSFNLTIHDQLVHVELFSVPVIEGTKFVLHLSPSSHSPSLESLGYWGNNLRLIKNTVAGFRGVMVISSPDRHSSAITLLSLAELVQPLSVVSLGDSLSTQTGSPQIETHRLPGTVSATQLRSVLRQKPNVVLLNNITDGELLSTAFENAKQHLICMAMTGTNNVDVLQRLTYTTAKPADMTVNFRLAMSQTVIPKLCAHCRQLTTITGVTKKQINALLNGFSLGDLHSLEVEAVAAGLGDDVPQLCSAKAGIEQVWRVKAGGCKYCNFSGYHQYTTVNEVVNMQAGAIASTHANPSTDKANLRTAAIHSGMIPEHIDGLVKCLRGILSLSDVFDVAHTTGYLVA